MKRLAIMAIALCMAMFVSAEAFAQSRGCRLYYPPYRGCSQCVAWGKGSPGTVTGGCVRWGRCQRCYHPNL